MLGKNLGTFRSRGPLPRVKRRVQTSGAVVDASPYAAVRPARKFRRKPLGIYPAPATSFVRKLIRHEDGESDRGRGARTRVDRIG